VGLRAFEDGSLFAETGGNGPFEVLALHGWGRRGSDFSGCLEGLRYLAVDLPGFGASPPPAAATGARGYAHLIKPIFEVLSPGAVIVGHSFGGRVAVAAAAANPGSFSGLVLSGVPLLRRPARSPSVKYRLARWAGRRGWLSEARLERMKRRTGSTDYRAASGVMRDVLVQTVNESYESELASLTVPVSLVWGELDREVPVTVAENGRDLLQGSGVSVVLRVLGGVGHLVPLQAPVELRAAVEEMLAR
jgi:pimeloyl-ACP methyl ester carboxylesterase